MRFYGPVFNGSRTLQKACAQVNCGVPEQVSVTIGGSAEAL